MTRPLNIDCGPCIPLAPGSYSSFVQAFVTVWVEPGQNFAPLVEAELERRGLRQTEKKFMIDALHQVDSVVIDGQAQSRIFDQMTYREPDWTVLPDWREWSGQQAGEPL